MQPQQAIVDGDIAWDDVIEIRPWAEEDRFVLEEANTPTMTRFTGGLESPAQLAARHDRYLAQWRRGQERRFAIVLRQRGRHGIPIGAVGYCPVAWDRVAACESGCVVLPDYQGHGYASRAVVLAIAHAEHLSRARHVHAYPRPDDDASNAICKQLGFALTGGFEAGAHPEHPLAANDWDYDLGRLPI